MTMGYIRLPQVEFEAFSGGRLFLTPPFRRETDLQAPAFDEEHAGASAPADDARARFLLGRCLGRCCSGRRALRQVPHPRPDAAAGAPVSSVPPWHTLARHLAPPPSARPRVSGTRKLTCAPSAIGWLASAHALAVRSGCAS